MIKGDKFINLKRLYCGCFKSFTVTLLLYVDEKIINFLLSEFVDSSESHRNHTCVFFFFFFFFFFFILLLSWDEPRHGKKPVWHMQTANVQTSMCVRTVLPELMLFVQVSGILEHEQVYDMSNRDREALNHNENTPIQIY